MVDIGTTEIQRQFLLFSKYFIYLSQNSYSIPIENAKYGSNDLIIFKLVTKLVQT